LGEPVAVSATAGEGLADLYNALRPVVDAAAEQAGRIDADETAARQIGDSSGSSGRGKGEQGEPQQGKGSSGGGGGGSSGGGWAPHHHLSSSELAELTALREHEGAALSDLEGDESSEDDKSDLDLEEISVAEDGSILGDARRQGSWGERGEQLPGGPLRVALMGAPNSGKSTLLNSLLGWERALTGA